MFLKWKTNILIFLKIYNFYLDFLKWPKFTTEMTSSSSRVTLISRLGASWVRRLSSSRSDRSQLAYPLHIPLFPNPTRGIRCLPLHHSHKLPLCFYPTPIIPNSLQNIFKEIPYIKYNTLQHVSLMSSTNEWYFAAFRSICLFHASLP